MPASKEDFKTGFKVLGGNYLLRVSPDKMRAFLDPQRPNALFPEGEALRQLHEFLKTKGVVFGLYEEPRWENGYLVLAEGKPPERGRDAYLEWFVPVERKEDLEATRIDLRERNAILCVEEGQKIAKLHPPSPGKPGRNVFGEEIPASSGQELHIETNEWVDFDPETGLFVARKAGALKVYPHCIEIHPEFWLDGDVNWDTGNVRFRGEKLVVTGDVKRGFKVEVQGLLEVHGNIEDEAEVVVKGDLLVEGLLHGDRARVFCQGNARIGAIEYARAEIYGDLVITDYTLQARLEVAGNFICTEGVGAVVGGELIAEGGILARVLGSRAHVATYIRAGCNPLLLRRIEEIKAKLHLLTEAKIPLLKAFEKGVQLLKEKKLSRDQIKILEKLKERLSQMLKEEKQFKKQLGRLIREKRRLEQRVKIKITGHIFAGTVIEIGEQKYTVAEDLSGGIFLVQHGQLRYFPLPLPTREED